MKTKNSPLRVSVLRIHNVLGVGDAEILPGQVTVIEGANGTGKTSRIEAFKAVITGGHDATLLRKGEETGEIVMVLSDGVEIRKRINGAKSDTTINHPEFGKLAKPAAYLDGLRDAFSVNPIDFLTAEPKERVKLLLSAIPMTVNPIDLAGIIEYCKDKPDLSGHALPVLAAIEKDLREQRTGINRTAKEKRASVEEMTKALPPEASADGKTVLESVELEYSDFRTAFENERASIVAASNDKVAVLQENCRAAIAKLAAQRDEQIEAIRREYESGSETIRRASELAIEADRKNAKTALDAMADDRATKTQQFESALATARANAEAYTRSNAARALIAKMASGAATLESDAEALSTALTELENVRGNLLERLPIKGVTLSDGEINVDGVAFDRVNESRRIRLAFEIAGLRTGKLPFMVIDGAERLDASSLRIVADIAVEENLQLVLSKVTDGPLRVERIA